MNEEKELAPGKRVTERTRWRVGGRETEREEKERERGKVRASISREGRNYSLYSKGSTERTSERTYVRTMDAEWREPKDSVFVPDLLR